MITQLFIHNIGYLGSATLSFLLGFFVFMRGRTNAVNILYFVNNTLFAIYVIAYCLGVNTYDPIASQHYLVFTMINLFTVCTTAHLAFVMFGKMKQQRDVLIGMYTGACVLMIFFLSDINRFMLPSVPTQYFPNFYTPGPYYQIYFLFFVLCAGYFFYTLAHSYGSADPATKSRIKYFVASFGFGYLVGSLNFLPSYGVNIDPAISSVLGLYTIPLAYGILKYDLIDINVVAKNALLYAGGTACVGGFIIGVNFLNNFLIANYSDFPIWIIPLLSGLVVVGVGVAVWRQIRNADILKYEFINNISHKFRTPLTRIRWLSEELRNSQDQLEKNQTIEQIQSASMRLFELTNIVIDTARDNSESYLYHFNTQQLKDIFVDILKTHEDQIKRKALTVEIHIPDNLPAIVADRTRIQFALQILFENALIYTPASGRVDVEMKAIEREVITTIKDSGIGIAPEDLSRMFSKFYRADNARRTDTEGMGIGLFMAKNIVEKHHGRLWAESAGEGKGSTFSFALPTEA